MIPTTQDARPPRDDAARHAPSHEAPVGSPPVPAGSAAGTVPAGYDKGAVPPQLAADEEFPLSDPARTAPSRSGPPPGAPSPSDPVDDPPSPFDAAQGAVSPLDAAQGALSPLDAAQDALSRDGYAFVPAQAMRAMLDADALTHWDGFAASWNHLGIDRFMADGGRYRRRRHAVFSVGRRGIERKPHQPHYQSRDYNALNGGVERWFTPVEDAIAAHPVLRAVLETCQRTFDALTPPGQRPEAWHVELHQFRIEPSDREDGKPTPEGLHRDGVDWVLVLLVSRENIERGVTTIHDLQQRELGAFTLAQPLDAALVDDGRVYHGVTAVRPLDPSLPSHRDVLVVTFRRQ